MVRPLLNDGLRLIQSIHLSFLRSRLNEARVRNIFRVSLGELGSETTSSSTHIGAKANNFSTRSQFTSEVDHVMLTHPLCLSPRKKLQLLRRGATRGLDQILSVGKSGIKHHMFP
jgi:hypothetical protein